MSVKPLDTLLGFKAMGLVGGLRESDRRVACALLDHLNRKTGQCDPSLETIAALLGISRRTVIRATSRLEAAGLFRKIRHGGNFHRNFYVPDWQAFERIEADWKARREQRRRSYAEKLSPSRYKPGHDASDSGATETCRSNLSNVTSPSRTAASPTPPLPAVRVSETGEGRKNRPAQGRTRPFAVRHVQSRDAKREVAQRRWDNDLLVRFASEPKLYGLVVAAIDASMAEAATEAELAKAGTGLEYIVQQLKHLALGHSEEPRS
jgi:hypothetical protein